jgi:hypothetical protein
LHLNSVNTLALKVRFRVIAVYAYVSASYLQIISQGTRIVQADSGSDSDSESRRQLAVQADSGSDSDSRSRRQSAQRMSFVYQCGRV